MMTQRKSIRFVLALVSLLLAAPGLLQAQIVNGDFELGGMGWTVDVPPGGVFPQNWEASFPSVGGNPDGYALIRSPFSGVASIGIGCINQTFQCGAPGTGTCTIRVMVRHETLDAAFQTGFIHIFVDGVEEYSSPPAQFLDWTLIVIQVPCGEHTIELCMEETAMNSAWQACFDNVEAECDNIVANDEGSWGRVKALYETQ